MSTHLSVVPRDQRQSQARLTSSPSSPTPPPTGFDNSTVRSSEVRKPQLLDQVRQVLRFRHYSYQTEKTYVHWIKRFIFFHDKRHPREMGKAEVEQFLTALAVDRHVSAATQNQALHATGPNLSLPLLIFPAQDAYRSPLPSWERARERGPLDCRLRNADFRKKACSTPRFTIVNPQSSICNWITLSCILSHQGRGEKTERLGLKLRLMPSTKSGVRPSGDCLKRLHVLREAQHERRIRNDFRTGPVRPEPVEGRMPVKRLNDSAYTVEYLEVMLEEDDMLEVFLLALRNVAEA